MTEVIPCPTCGGSGVVTDAAGGSDPNFRDHDQTGSDQDQTWSDHDQTRSDRDQRSADEDQHASDDDFAAGSDPLVHSRTAAARERSSGERHAVSELRDATSTDRLTTAATRDETARIHNRSVAAHDRLAARVEGMEDDVDESTLDILLRAERDRERAAIDRAKAADDRSRAAADREEATSQRAESHRARTEARHNLELAATDELTGARARKFGLAELAREIERARRTGERLTLAFIDVDGLKEVNDTDGHPAGDRLLHLVVETVKANIRPYDVVVRYGGDEFLCVMPNLAKGGAKTRMKGIAAKLRALDKEHSVTFGLAEYDPVDGMEEFILRADADLLATRRAPGGSK